jgi:hypothetical protein
MLRDMHYEGVYALARSAGMKPAVAGTIATASQYVDDAFDDAPFDLTQGGERQGAILPTMTSHRALDYRNAIASDQWQVWLPFHFLPGNEGTTYEERLTCRNNSSRPVRRNGRKSPANRIIEFAMSHAGKPWGPHMAGVVAHVYADTFAHYGFIGRGTPSNRVDNGSLKVRIEKPSIREYVLAKKDLFLARNAGRLAEFVPVAHGSVATYPDRPYLQWKVRFEDGRKMPVAGQWRDNRADYLLASEYLAAFFRRLAGECPTYVAAAGGVAWDGIRDAVAEVIAFEGKMDERGCRWRKAAMAGKLFHVSRAESRAGGIPDYELGEWESDRIRERVAGGADPKRLDGVLFFHAAALLRRFIHDELLGGLGLITQV